MNTRSIAATIALCLVHCDPDPRGPDPSATAPLTVAAPSPATSTPTPTPPSPIAEIPPVVEHAGRRWVVLAASIADDAAMGDPSLVERHEVVVTESSARPDAVPARLRGIQGRAVLLHGSAGATCRATLGAPRVLARVDVHFGEDQRWDGIDDEGHRGSPVAPSVVAQEAYAQADDGRLLVAELSPTGCGGALFAHDEAAPVVTFRASAADTVTQSAAVVAYRSTAAWRRLQNDYLAHYEDLRPARSRWDDANGGAVVTVWTPDGAGRTFVTVRGVSEPLGCAAFSGALLAVFERVGGRLVLRSPAGVATDFLPVSAVDSNGDGAPDFYSTEGVMGIGPEGYERTLSLQVPSHDCPC